ncbi:MAG: NUDIX hydrolase [Acidimicrobiales bacterium]
MVDLARLRDAFVLGSTSSSLPGSEVLPRAAVAAVFRDGGRLAELLFIERAVREGDPWSGHMALPGGRVEPDDLDLNATAERETFEEIGLDLRVGERLGQLDELHGGVRPITVSAHGYWLHGERPRLELNHEVADAFWVPLPELANPARFVAYEHPVRVGETFPGVEVEGGRVVWGLTLRLLVDLFARLRHPFLVSG